MIRVVVADDHPIVRAGVVSVLHSAHDIEVVGEASDGQEAIQLAQSVQADIVLMDLRMPRVDGVEATRAVTTLTRSKVLILTTYETDDQILQAIEAGASGYLLKASPQEEILAGIRSVSVGHTALSPAIAAKLVQQVRAVPQRTLTLSPRESEILRLVAQGNSNREVARALFIGEATVKTHLLHVFEKLQVNDRTRAVTRAMELGLF